MRIHNTHKPLNLLQRYLLMTAGILIMAIGIYFFKFPNNFSTGGVSGISIILGRLFPDSFLSPSTVMLIINTLLLVLGFLILGRSFAFSTVYCSMLLSLTLSGMERIWPMTTPMTDQPMLELFFAVLLPAIGSAILFNLDASSGGTDIVAMIVRKYSNMNIGTALMIADIAITVAALFFFGPKTGLFSILGLLLKSLMVDYIMDILRSRKCFQIITTQTDSILDYIMTTLHRGATIEEVQGAFSHNQMTMIITVLNRPEALMLRKYIHTVDPHAFIVITTSTEIVGKGFLSI